MNNLLLVGNWIFGLVIERDGFIGGLYVFLWNVNILKWFYMKREIIIGVGNWLRKELL